MYTFSPSLSSPLSNSEESHPASTTMSLFREYFSWLCADHFKGKFHLASDTHLAQFTMSMLNSTCTTSANDTCKDDSGALTLKLVAMSSILVAGATGIAIPLFGSRRSTLLAADSNLFVAAKAFAAGVILATGFVHMMPDGADNLSNTCLPTYPWSSFPFAGFFVMLSALFTLFADFVGNQLYEKKQKKKLEEEVEVAGEVCRRLLDGAVTVEDEPREKHVVDVYVDGHGHGHGHGQGHKVGGGKGEDGARHAVVSQVLELGIVSHSVIIGLSLGVSRSPCTIRPLVAALSFHQFFEGFALGGCIAQANFSHLHTAIMACFFAATNPASIAAGVALASFYDPTSAAALIVEGILDCVSAGILIYMALVDLIAAEFMSQQMRSNARLQIVSFLALFLGASLMSSLAIWS